MAKILKHSVPPGYQRGQAPKRPKLDPYTGIIDQILEDDKSESKKQRHTCKRIFEWLRDEHGYSGGITIVTDYVRARKRLGKEVFVPLAHDPGHAQVDFGEAWAIIAGVRRKVHYFALDLPHSDACFVKAYPAETTEAFCDGHVAAFGFFGGIPLSILYDNTTLAVAKIKKDGKRVRTETFTKLQSHYLFQDKFARPAKGNEKGKVEGLIGYVRRNYLVPIPRFDSFDALNAWLEEQCLKRQGDRDDSPFPASLLELQRLFPVNAACAVYLEKARWGNGFVCPYCHESGDPFRFRRRSTSPEISPPDLGRALLGGLGAP